MSKSEVIEIIGQPVLKDCYQHECRWYYTRLPVEVYGYYDAKYLDFKDGRVKEVHDHYFGD